MATRTGQQRNKLPHCYYEGYLEKRSFKDKTSRKLWTCLSGNTLFFFNNSKDVDYVEKLDLIDFISVKDDSSQDHKLDAARFNLWLKDKRIKLTAPSLEARELWKGYIHSVVEFSVPSCLTLLPGQIHMLKEAAEKEQERVKALSSPQPTSDQSYVNVETDMPACFQQVSRMEAELLLDRETWRGNLLLRPGRDGNSFAVTTRQDLNGSVFKHYRVTQRPGDGFIIDVDNPIPCATLQDVITFLVEKTGRALIPFMMEEHYEDNITFVKWNEENGEKSLQFATPNIVQPPLPSLPPRPAEEPVAAVCPPPRFPHQFKVTTLPKSALFNETLNSPRTEKNSSRQALMPPLPRLIHPSSSSVTPSSSSGGPEERRRRITLSSMSAHPQLSAISEELKQRFDKKGGL